MRISIIGGGEIGSALYHLLKNKKGLDTCVFDRDSKKTICDTDQKSALQSSDVVFMCIPSNAFDKALEELRDQIPKKSIIASLTKGFVDKKLVSDILSRQPFDYALLGGPMIAEEILEDKLGFADIGTESAKTYSAIANLFTQTRLHIGKHMASETVAIYGILKNIYAVAIGIGYGLAEQNNSWGLNAQGFLVTHAQLETKTIFSMLKIDQGGTQNLAGLGDLFTTGTSAHSSNHTAGKSIAHNTKPVACEGLRSLPILAEKIDQKKTPVLQALLDITEAQQDPLARFLAMLE